MFTDKRKSWSSEQIDVLKVEYPAGSRLDELAKKLRKSPSAIKTVASRLHLERITRQVHRTEIRASINTPILRHLTQAEIGYIAGLFDGEGSISIHYTTVNRATKTNRRWTHKVPAKRRWYLTINITNTDPRAIQWLIEKMPFGRESFAKPSTPNRRIPYFWRLGVVYGAHFCHEIAPYLIIKKNEAELVAEALKAGFTPLSNEQRERLRQDLHTLKSKGPKLV